MAAPDSACNTGTFYLSVQKSIWDLFPALPKLPKREEKYAVILEEESALKTTALHQIQ